MVVEHETDVRCSQTETRNCAQTFVSAWPAKPEDRDSNLPTHKRPERVTWANVEYTIFNMHAI